MTKLPVRKCLSCGHFSRKCMKDQGETPAARRPWTASACGVNVEESPWGSSGTGEEPLGSASALLAAQVIFSVSVMSSKEASSGITRFQGVWLFPSRVLRAKHARQKCKMKLNGSSGIFLHKSEKGSGELSPAVSRPGVMTL